MNGKEEKILDLLKEKNKMFTMEEMSDMLDGNRYDTFFVLNDLIHGGKIKFVRHNEKIFYASEETTLAFEKKIREVEVEFGIY